MISEGLDPDQTPIRAILAVDNTANASLRNCLEYMGPYAYSVYLDRFKDANGFSRPDWIDYYINPFWDSDWTDWPSAAHVLAAINSLPSDVGRLYVHLIGEAGSGGASVLLAPGDSLTASALDGALDALQARQTCAVILIVDAPGSGAFLPVCRATGAQQRVVFTSGRNTDAAYFLAWPTLTCFSQKFLGAAYQGNDLKTAFQSGDTFFNQFLRYYLGVGRIKPQMDDNGDGLYSAAADGALAKTLYLGRRYAFAGSEGAGLPFILETSTTQTVPMGGMPASYTIRLIEGIEPTRVFAQVTGSDSATSTETVSSVSEVEFTRDAPTSWTWSGAVAAPFTSGTYSVTFYAAYPDMPADKLSEPAFSGLVVTNSVSSPDIYDLPPYNDDESSTTLNYLSPGVAQEHTIYAVGNMDWFKCITISDAMTPFSLAFTTMTLPAGSSLVVKIYEDGPENPETDDMTLDASGGEYTWMSLGLGAETVFFSVEAVGPISPEFRYFVTFERNTGANNGVASALGSDAMQVEWDNSAPPALGDGFYIQQSLPWQMSGFARINTQPIAPQPGRMKVAETGLQPLTLYFYQIERVSGGVSEMWTLIFYGMTTDAGAPLSLPGVAFADAVSTISEGATTATLTVALSRVVEWIGTVDYAATGGTATGGGVDYALTSGTLVFAPGQTTATIEVSIYDNALYEPDETVVIALSLPQGAALAGPSSHTLTIVDNDPPPINTYTLTYNAGANGSISGATSQTVSQGASGTTVTAVPNTDYSFMQWSDASTTNPRRDMNVTTNITVTASFADNPLIEIVVSPSAWVIGSRSLNAVVESGVFVTTNTGNVAEDFTIRGTDGASSWTLQSAAGVNAFRVEVDQDKNGSYDFNLTKSEQPLASNVAVGGSQTLGLRYSAPTSDTLGAALPQDFVTIIKASRHVP